MFGSFSTFRLTACTAALGLALAMPAAPSAAVVGPDVARCRSNTGQPALLVNVAGLRNRQGSVRVMVYGSNPAEFLVRGKWLKRVDVPVVPTGSMQICVALPGAGTYAIAVRHDADANRKTGWNDGGGYSNNPPLSITNLKPSYRKAAISVGNGVRPVNVVLNYRQGFSVRPIA
jgi:uncharacterized protein (DUF2141 family)